MNESHPDKAAERLSRTDDFWSMDELLPKRRTPAFFSSDTGTVEIPVTSGPAPAAGEPVPKPETAARLRAAREALRAAEIRLSDRAAAAAGNRPAPSQPGSETPDAYDPDTPLFSYVPEDNPLVEKVTVYPWPSRYSFYERFRRDAIRLFDETGAPCPAVPFFSYTPQYVQLSPEQLAYYLYWRQELREGRFLPVDFAYLLLFLYEIINLPDRIAPEDGAALLGAVWKEYRGAYPKLDRFLAEWTCDYCLIRRTAPPFAAFGGFLDRIVEAASLKSFYIGADRSVPSPYALILLNQCASYHWRSSKFLTDENRPLFEKHIPGAFLYAFTKAETDRVNARIPLGKAAMIRHTTVRDAFSGALCAYPVKCRVEVTFLSCSRSVELRYVATDAVKYAENNVRSLLGIRSRFHTPNLAPPLRQLIDEYFRPFKEQRKKETVPPAPAYDRLYEPEQRAFSLSLAKTLEKQGWKTTERLIGAVEEETAPKTPLPDAPAAVSPIPVPPVPSASPACAPVSPAPSEIPAPASTTSAEPDTVRPPASSAPGRPEKKPPWLLDALACCLNADSDGFAAIAREQTLLPDALAMAVNEALYDTLSDTALEETEAGYRPVPDYLEEIVKWMKT